MLTCRGASRSEVTSRGTGSAVRTPIDEFEARPRNELRCFFTGVMFLTRLPCPGWCDHHPGYLMRGMAYFPLLGALIGVWAAAFYDAAAGLWSPLIAAAVSSGRYQCVRMCAGETRAPASRASNTQARTPSLLIC